jgi:predicted nucleic acid-binding protein
MAYLIDTDVRIDISREMPEAMEYVDLLPSDWMISKATAMALIVGARDKQELANLDEFLSAQFVLALTERFGALVTRDKKHFHMIGGLSVEFPRY